MTTTTAPIWTGRMSRPALIFLLCLLSNSVLVFSRPTALQRRQELPTQFDAQPNPDQGSSKKIWIPVMVVALALTGLAILIWCRRFIWKAISGLAGASGATRMASPPGVREITAEQLAGNSRNNAAGGNNGNNNNNNNNTGTTGRPRRTRRPRRTPSQVSTTSLPAYMKEPGEEELVIYRGPEDMEDNPIPPATNVVMPPVDEDANESAHSHSRNASQASDYPPAPDSPNDMPLLTHDEDIDDATSPGLLRSPPGEGMPTRPSTETVNTTSEGPTSLIPVPSRITAEADTTADPRGAAPPYFEVIDLNESQRDLANSPSTLSDPSEPRTPPSSSGSSAPRRSAFMSLWHSIGGSGSASQTPPGSGSGLPTHTRVDSGMSMNSSSQSHGNQPPRTSTSRFSHRPTASNSSSILSPFRTLSRQKSTSFSTRSVHSNNNLNSPSLISLNSISSPLTHTAVRTEFSYPKAGPTPEQMKLISSRESFARFGKPYGPAAVAFAASTSMMDLSPPPDFEAVNSETNLIGGGGSRPSRLRNDSQAASIGGRGHVRDGSDSSLEEMPVGSSGDSPSATPEFASGPQQAEQSHSNLVPDAQDRIPTHSEDQTPPTSTPSSSSSTTPSIPVSSPPSSAPTSPPTTASSSQLQQTEAKPEPNALVSPTTTTGLAPVLTSTHNVPPSSFRGPSSTPFRPESRASSMVSFATAAETLPPSTPAPPSDSEDSEDEAGRRQSFGRRDVGANGEESDYEEENTVLASSSLGLGINTNVGGSIGRGKRGTLIVESPSTPVMKGSQTLHVQEGTDATITQDALGGVGPSKASSRQSTLSTMTVVPRTQGS